VIYYYRLQIQYKGTRYLGWQVQPEGAGSTVQGELNKALTAISKAESRSLGSGRTDAGVHALGQVVKVAIELEIPVLNLIKALNANLPDDIRVLHAERSDEEFMPTVHAVSKDYHYRFTCTRSFSAFQNELVANYPFELDFELMQKACKVFIGKHDFINFYCEGTDVSSTVREIFECDLIKAEAGDWGMLPSHYVFRVKGSGFLKQMVRLLVGAMWNVGRGKITIEQLEASLKPPRVQRLGPVAPPEGLYMVRVNY
jgi:tRNA pseudouridine38-40 synthase